MRSTFFMFHYNPIFTQSIDISAFINSRRLLDGFGEPVASSRKQATNSFPPTVNKVSCGYLYCQQVDHFLQHSPVLPSIFALLHHHRFTTCLADKTVSDQLKAGPGTGKIYNWFDNTIKTTAACDHVMMNSHCHLVNDR